MQVVQGIYANGKITFDNIVPVKNARVVVIFVESDATTIKMPASSANPHIQYLDRYQHINEEHVWVDAVDTSIIEEPKKLKAYGILNEISDRTDIDGEKGVWERAVVEKYAKGRGS